MSQNIDDISLNFINLPHDKFIEIQDKPPLLSAFQSLDTGFLLLAHGRHPQALANFATAIESAAKAHLQLNSEDKFNLAEALPDLNFRIPKERALPLKELKRFREKRNQITHYGYSSRDDEESVQLIFTVALPFIDAWIEHSMGFSLIDALQKDLAEKVRLAMELIKTQINNPITAVNAIRGVVKLIQYLTRESYMTWWEYEILEQDASKIGSGYELKSNMIFRYQQELYFGSATAVITCPICDAIESLVVKLDDEQLVNNKQLVLLEAHCVDCELNLPENSKTLLQQLCNHQLTNDLRDIALKEFGIK